MAKRAVILFAGQGAQAVGMGRDLAESFPSARELFEKADTQLGLPLSRTMFDGPTDELTRTSLCQPALYVHGLACLGLLRERFPDLEIAGAAGLSLGEFTAHAAAGSFDFATGLALVAKRGRYMEECTDATEGAMAAMIGGEPDDIQRLADDCGIDVANYNAPGQTVLSGTKEGVAKAVETAQDYGVRVPRELDVAGAYHSRLMRPAQEKLAADLAELPVDAAAFPVVCNVDARPVDGSADLRRSLEEQVSGSVRWSDSIRYFLDEGETTFIELGPGRVLAGLMKRIDRSANTLSFGDAEGFEKVVEALADTV